MSLAEWVLACLWLAGIVTVVMLVLTVIAFADPARRRRSRAGTTPSRR